MNTLASDTKKQLVWLVLIIGLAVIIRVLAIPAAMTSESDAVDRTWIAWRWLANPQLIYSGVWGPLHTYLIASALAIVSDPVALPIFLHIVFSVLTAIPLYFFTKNEFKNDRAALFVAAAYILYPVAIRNSLMTTAEPPFAFFLALSLFFLSLARQDSGTWKHAVAAGLSLTLAAGFRFEAWTYIPLLGIALWRKPRLMVAFGIASLIFPVFWMVGNQIQYGDPLYSFHWNFDWNMSVDPEQGGVFQRTIYYPLILFLGMTPIIALLAVGGAFLSVIKRKPAAIWLMPILGTLALYTFAAARYTLTLHGRYIITVATVFFPFIAEAFNSLPVWQNLQKRRTAALVAELIMIASIVPFAYMGNLVPIGVVQRFFETGINPIPKVKNPQETAVISDNVNKYLNKGDGFITDFYKFDRTYYVALMTRLHPNQVFVAPGGPNEQADWPGLTKLLEQYQSGLILLQKDSRFSKAISFIEDGRATINGKPLTLEKLNSFASEDPTLTLYRYRMASTP